MKETTSFLFLIFSQVLRNNIQTFLFEWMWRQLLYSSSQSKEREIQTNSLLQENHSRLVKATQSGLRRWSKVVTPVRSLCLVFSSSHRSLWFFLLSYLRSRTVLSLLIVLLLCVNGFFFWQIFKVSNSNCYFLL